MQAHNCGASHAEAKTRTARNSNVEMLRIVIMFGILLWHVTMHGYGMAKELPAEHGFMNSLCIALFVPCVNLFVLISGYYGIKLKLSSIARFEAQAVFYSYAIAVVMYFAFHDLGAPLITVSLPVLGKRWWFLTTYLMLTLAAPVLNEGVKRLTKRQLLLSIAGLIAINSIGKMLKLDGGGSDFQTFMIVYLTGRFLRFYKEDYKVFSNCKAMLIGGGDLPYLKPVYSHLQP